MKAPQAIALQAPRLLALTGGRRSEELNLRWRNIGADALNFNDSKTGPRAVPLGEVARALIEALPGPRDPDAFLFPRHAEGRGIWILTTCWRAVCADAKLGRLRLHDLRHTAASHAVMSGENRPLVGKLLGHRRLRPPRRCPSRRCGGEGREHHRAGDEPRRRAIASPSPPVSQA